MMGVMIHLLRQVDFLCGRCETSGYQGGVSGVSGGGTIVSRPLREHKRIACREHIAGRYAARAHISIYPPLKR